MLWPKSVSMNQSTQMTREEYNKLYEKCSSGKCTSLEQKELESYQDSFEFVEMDWDTSRMGDPETIKRSLQAELKESLEAFSRQRIRRIRTWYSAAAILLIILSAGLYFNRKTEAPVLAKTIPPRFQNDVLPGDNRAVLTLDDGSQINLDDAENGLLASESNIEIKKVGTGQVEYTGGSQSAQTVKYNSLSTPMGGQYQLVLPDGSKVWLNSGSSLRFPTAFVGSERIVELKGEAYFEISKNKQMPFRVRTNNAMDVKVLGTHFNIMAYDDEKNISTTLLEGSVQVLKESGTVLLQPGQEASMNKGTGKINVSAADPEEAIAWKNGYFIFSNENIESIMRKVSRWYNVEVTFQGNLSNKDFVGTISRNKNVSELLKMLELTGAVHFSIEGRRITVMP